MEYGLASQLFRLEQYGDLLMLPKQSMLPPEWQNSKTMVVFHGTYDKGKSYKITHSLICLALGSDANELRPLPLEIAIAIALHNGAILGWSEDEIMLHLGKIYESIQWLNVKNQSKVKTFADDLPQVQRKSMFYHRRLEMLLIDLETWFHLYCSEGSEGSSYLPYEPFLTAVSPDRYLNSFEPHPMWGYPFVMK